MKRFYLLVLIIIMVCITAFGEEIKLKIDGIYKTKTMNMETMNESDKDTLVKKVKNFYKEMKTFRGQFKEEIYLSFIEQTQFLTGSFMFKKEQYFRLETEENDRQLIISDGEVLWTYLIDDGICYKRTIKSAEDINALFEILPIGDFDLNFNVNSSENAEFYLLELNLKDEIQKNISFEKIIYVLNKKNLNPELVYLWTKDGRILKLLFSNTEMNQELDDSQFKFEVPEKVEVIEY